MTPAQNPSRSGRARSARREVGATEVSRPVAWALLLLFGLGVLAPPVVQTGLDLAAGRGPLPVFGSPLELWRVFIRSDGAELEERLEEESWLRAALLPPTQGFLTAVLGLGNERVISGRGGWWYLSDDFRHVTGRGFLEPEVIERRFVAEGFVADPVPRLAALAADLERHGVELVVLPVPAKPTVVPGPLSSRPLEPPIHNASYGELLERLAARGVGVHDPTADLVALETAGVQSFLRTDTHWSPAAVDRVAAGLADRLRAAGAGGGGGAGLELYRRRAAVSASGDLAKMLRLPDRPRIPTETVEVDLVLTPEGDLWRPSGPERQEAGEPTAEVLLLGDSFANVFSDPSLGWGGGGGLAEQLAFHLGAAVDRIALNNGGATGALATLEAHRAAHRDALAGRRFLVFEFAARELSLGDWRLPEGVGADL